MNNLPRLSAGDSAQPEIRSGDIWKDKHGNKITIRSVIPTRIYFDREGYPHICSCPARNFIHEFERVSAAKMPISGWRKENDLLTRIEKLRRTITRKGYAK
jgi:hypothetical protein